MTLTTDSYTSDPLADRVARLCCLHFENVLIKKGKPQKNKEWTIIAAIVVHDLVTDSLRLVSMGTGSKCIGQGKMSATGDVLHDSHAEIMARRGFVRYLYHCVEQVYTGKQVEDDFFVLDPISRKCNLKEGLSLLFFCSHTPCGDASIVPMKDCGSELQPTRQVEESVSGVEDEGEPPRKMARKDDVHRTGAKCVEGGPQDPKLPGLEHHVVGALRTKPGRGDQTLSMSCSDKIARWNMLGVQGSLLMNFLERPVYVSHLIVGKCPYDATAMHRAVYGRFLPLRDEIDDPPYQLNPMRLSQSNVEFEFSKAAVCLSTPAQPCPSSIVWCKCPHKELEVAVEGRKQGATKKTQNRPAGRLDVCRKHLLQKFVSIVRQSTADRLPHHLHEWLPKLDELTYDQAKQLSRHYVRTWQRLRRRVVPTWTTKGQHLTQFLAKDDPC